ncbi:hydroxyisourate hydrolase [Actinophytocola xanthii]|uniref:5-hydroxyisourate hydrolase n=1 Tax=Actinophytocola xanthii TaxID=1912961 RepID=A0A1Q8CU94_9PSEU|nr:hydroxyisourate hydrolase [Actinophytocola xanthii]OLF17937.1 hydroxyisourate hydrolase [Actinophytocola xanthii]
MSLSTHVLDTSVGRPAPDVPVRLEARGDDGWEPLARGRTDADGRLAGWEVPAAGVYRLVFDVGDHLGAESFYPEVGVVFRVVEPAEHHHVPLLVSPYGYTTYRGS